tara:strand:- start:162 stop:755 length:594 start_codon:yes stop_codon:yes gene_type:complete
MLLLSIDVGIRNLAYVVINVDEIDKKSSIIDWNIMELCEKDENACKVDNTKIGAKMNEHMLKLLDKFVFDKVIIENQIGQNAIKMKSIQSMIVMFFVTQNYKQEQIINYNAANKLKYFLGKKKTTYAERKKLSKKITNEICISQYSDWVVFFQQCKKKDDLADCLLQVLDYSIKNAFLTTDVYDNVSDDFVEEKVND